MLCHRVAQHKHQLVRTRIKDPYTLQRSRSSATKTAEKCETEHEGPGKTAVRTIIFPIATRTRSGEGGGKRGQRNKVRIIPYQHPDPNQRLQSKKVG